MVWWSYHLSKCILSLRMFNLQYPSSVFFSTEMTLEFLFLSKLKFSLLSCISLIFSCRLSYHLIKKSLRNCASLVESPRTEFGERNSNSWMTRTSLLIQELIEQNINALNKRKKTGIHPFLNTQAPFRTASSPS